MLKGCEQLQGYITEELNVLKMSMDADEMKYVVYSCEPDNKIMGQALKKKFDKNFKKKIAALTSDELKAYLKDGCLQLEDVTIEKGWLAVKRSFNADYEKSKTYKVASSDLSAVMLNTVIDDELRQVGLQREVINRIQRLRKAGQVLPTDEIEVFYKLNDEASGKDAWLNQVIQKFGDKISKHIKRPFLPASAMPKNSPLINDTVFEFVPEGAPKDAKPEAVQIYVCKPSPQVDPAALAKDVSADDVFQVLASYD